MTRRELEGWVAAHDRTNGADGVAVTFAFAPSADDGGGSSWASFTSRTGAGRVIRRSDGSSCIDVYAYRDGSCLRRERHPVVSREQLDSLAALLATRRPHRA